MNPSDIRSDAWKEFNRCWPWLDASIMTLGRTRDKNHVWGDIYGRQVQFWPGENSAILTRIVTYPTGLRYGNAWVAGGELEEIKVQTPGIEGWLKTQGCEKVLLLGRPGWGKVLDGYENTGVRLVKAL